jgi:uncharacterized protein (UPF0335 family)
MSITSESTIGEFMGRMIEFQAEIDDNAAEKKEISERRKEVEAEAKASGIDVAIMKKALAAIKKGVDAHDEEVSMVDLYLVASGKK